MILCSAVYTTAMSFLCALAIAGRGEVDPGKQKRHRSFEGALFNRFIMIWGALFKVEKVTNAETLFNRSIMMAKINAWVSGIVAFRFPDI